MNSQLVSQMAPQSTLQVAPQTGPQALLDFTCFPKLPIELKCRIWGLVACHERDVDITIEKSKYQVGGRRGAASDSMFIYKSSSAHPAILHTSQEARNEGLRYYTLSFGSKFEGGGNSRNLAEVETAPKIYVNFEVDRLWLHADSERNINSWTHFFTFGVQRVVLYASSARMLMPPEYWLHHPLKEICLYSGNAPPCFREWSWVTGTGWTTKSCKVNIPFQEKRMKPCVYKKNSSVRFINGYFDKWEKDPDAMCKEKRAKVLERLTDMRALNISTKSLIFEGNAWERPAVKFIEVDYS